MEEPETDVTFLSILLVFGMFIGMLIYNFLK